MKTKITVALFLALTLAMWTANGCAKKKDESMPGMPGMPAQDHSSHAAEQKAPKKALYYCPMHPNYTSDKPGTCPICGMDLVKTEDEMPVAADKAGKPEGYATVKIPAERARKIGVATSAVEMKEMEITIRAPGRVDYQEPRLKTVNMKFGGWVEKLNVDYTGKLVQKGDPLLSIYSPELLATQEEYLNALKASKESGRPEIVESAKRRLLLWDITEAQVEELGKAGKASKSMAIHSPISGFVIEKKVVEGQKVEAGTDLFKIADLSRIWVIANLYEYEMPDVKPGMKAKVMVQAMPGTVLSGTVEYVYPYLNPESRTVSVRIDLPNPDYKLKPDMFVEVEFNRVLGRRLVVPVEAIMDTGARKIAFVEKGEGVYEPREVLIGIKGNGVYEVKAGLAEGEKAVVSANFLIDSESRIRNGLEGTKQ
jgi:Cu(I)/Ag(I) efflux system membrane fusion protein